MFSLQITIRNLLPTDRPSSDTLSTITARFGSIQTEIEAENGSGGKKLLLQMEQQEMQDLIKNYAFGLFARGENDKYFAILSLQRMKIGEINCTHQIHFFNDHRQSCFQAEIVINLQHYQPKLPQRNQPPQSFSKKTTKTQKPQTQKIVSFLHGNLNKASKPPIPPQRPVKVAQKANPTIKNVKQVQKQMKIKPTNETDLDDDFFIPPVMQFTNNIEQQVLKVPTVPEYHPPTQIKQARKQNNYMLENKPQIKKKTTKQQLRQQARKQAEKYSKTQENIMIPMPRGGKYELVPLSSLKQTQIIDYANHQKMLQEERRKQKQLRRQLQEQRKKNQQRQMRKPPEHMRVKPIQHKQQNSPRVVIKEQEEERSQISQDYESDFDSISLGNSLLRSRHSLRSSNYNLSSQKKVQQSESIMDSGYSQQFESYSQSMLSYKKRANSISEISQSMRSISQSYKK